MDAYCSKCKGIKHAIVGVLILVNAFVWPLWTGLEGWLKFFGVLLIIGGIIRVFKPSCGHASCCCEEPAKKKK